MDSIKVFPMTVEDLSEVVEIEENSFAVPWSLNSFLSELIENERAVYLVAKDNLRRVLGYIGMWVVIDEGHITNLAVAPLFRRRGVGKKLLENLIKLSRVNGLERLTLEVRVSNTAAQKLYESFGFVSAGIRPRYYIDNNEDAMIMWNDLSKWHMQ